MLISFTDQLGVEERGRVVDQPLRRLDRGEVLGEPVRHT
jgi:hypothetical protein